MHFISFKVKQYRFYEEHSSKCVRLCKYCIYKYLCVCIYFYVLNQFRDRTNLPRNPPPNTQQSNLHFPSLTSRGVGKISTSVTILVRLPLLIQDWDVNLGNINTQSPIFCVGAAILEDFEIFTYAVSICFTSGRQAYGILICPKWSSMSSCPVRKTYEV